jgi:hypothetical protein
MSLYSIGGGEVAATYNIHDEIAIPKAINMERYDT